ncbi:MAG: hypothetical protein WBQ57_10255 [Rhodanobacteraceae bacterium]
MSSAPFVLNMKPGFVDMVSGAKTHHRILIGWGDAHGVRDKKLSCNDVRAKIREVFKSGKKSLQSAGYGAAYNTLASKQPHERRRRLRRRGWQQLIDPRTFEGASDQPGSPQGVPAFFLG